MYTLQNPWNLPSAGLRIWHLKNRPWRRKKTESKPDPAHKDRIQIRSSDKNRIQIRPFRKKKYPDPTFENKRIRIPYPKNKPYPNHFEKKKPYRYLTSEKKIRYIVIRPLSKKNRNWIRPLKKNRIRIRLSRKFESPTLGPPGWWVHYWIYEL